MQLKPYITKIHNFLRENVREAHFLFVVLAIPALIVFISILPPAWGLDEQVHTARAYQVSEGKIYPDDIKGKGGLYGGAIPTSLVDVLRYGHQESNAVPRQKVFFERQDIRNKKELQNKLDRKLNTKKTTNYEFGASGPYSPIVYAPAATGMFIGRQLNVSVGSVITFGKVFQAVTYIVMAAAALWIMRKNKSKWLLFVIALLPSSIYQAATINADSFTIGVTLLFLATVLFIFTHKKLLQPLHIGVLATATILLMLAKPSYSLLAGILLFSPVKPLFKNTKAKIITIGAILGAAALVFLISSLKGIEYGASILLYKDAATAAQIIPGDQVKWILTHPIGYVVVLWHTFVVAGFEWNQSLIGMLGYNTIATPFIFTYFAGIVLVLAALYDNKYSRNQALLLLGFGLLSALAVITILYGTFNVVGSPTLAGVQGRYFIPCLPFILLGLFRLLPVKLTIKDTAAAPLFACSSFLILYVTLYAYAKALF